MPLTRWRGVRKNTKDPGELCLPTSYYFLITLRMEKPRGHVPSTLFDDLRLDLPYGSTIKDVTSKYSTCNTSGVTYIVNCAIASHTD